ncbi:hypothetical protein JCGZ_24836 [Jatropha curcas]|uniref:Uncharacterized protein n=1 Tax=Jatropha curcas TaxID=180498 RepID=A0A067KXH6_JATCU|nr:protein CHUP1, chloroplastic [Jatropha curcas]XP_020533939.1 protein CHUP1, chloroplastic [Jatropha curcas]KDP40837.1 hypothetical protein JCGZ_24836 [Jatropha curcas]
MMKDKKDIRPVLFKIGAALALSFAGFLFSRMKSRRAKFPRLDRSPSSSDHDDGRRAAMKKTPNSGSIKVPAERNEDACLLKVADDNTMVVPSPSATCDGDKDGYLLPEFNDLVQELDFNALNARLSPKKDLETHGSDMETPKAFSSKEMDDCEQEIIHLKAIVGRLQEREKNLEDQLLECYGLKEQETAMIELQNRLKINHVETKLLTLKIKNLQEDNQRLQAQLADQAKIVADLDAARAKIKLLRKMLKSEAERNKEQILALQKRVARLQEQEIKAAATDSDIQSKLETLKDLEAEAEDLRQSNSRLHLENFELACKLESTQILANPEIEALRALSNQLRQENEELVKEVERLQTDRCTDVEELVYLRWINACLRYELRNFQPLQGKTVARDLSKSLSPKSEEKAKQLILEYANIEGTGEKGIDIMDLECDQWSSCHTSYILDPTDFDDSSVSTKTKNSSKDKIFNKLRKLILGKDIQHHNHGSSSGKSGAEDSDSPRGSSCISTTTDAASDLQSNRAKSQSPDLPRHSARYSVDIRRLKNPTTDEMQDIKMVRRNSDSVWHRRYLSGGITANNLLPENQDSYPIEKSELLKFAQVLKDSGSGTGKIHRKSASLGAF